MKEEEDVYQHLLHCKKLQIFHGIDPFTLGEGSLYCKGLYIPSAEGINPFGFKDLVKNFFFIVPK